MTDDRAGRVDGRRLKTAVIGTGFVGPHHVDAVRRNGYADVDVLVGSDSAHTARRAQELGVSRWSTDVDAVLGDGRIDVVHVCTPNDTHVPLARTTLEAGKHLVLEKPIALDSAGARELVDAAARTGRHAMVALTYRGYPMVRRARRPLKSESWGRFAWSTAGTSRTGWLMRPTTTGASIPRSAGSRGRSPTSVPIGSTPPSSSPAFGSRPSSRISRHS